MEIATLSLGHDRPGFGEEFEEFPPGQPHSQPGIDSDVDEAIYPHIEGAVSLFSEDLHPSQKTFAYITNNPFQPDWTPENDHPYAIFEPSHQPDILVRPVGYEDKRDKRPKPTGSKQPQEHPQRYYTDWDAFGPSTPPPNPPPTLRERNHGEIVFNIRASNIDCALSHATIEAFFRARCTRIQGFRAKTVSRRKVVYLAISEDAARHDVLALNGSRFGRHRIKVEWNASGFRDHWEEDDEQVSNVNVLPIEWGVTTVDGAFEDLQLEAFVVDH